MCTAGITYITAQHNAEDVLQEAWLAASRGTNERPAILCKDGEDSVNSQVPIKAAQAAMEQAMADDNFKAYSLPVSTLHGTRGTFFELMATLQENDDQPETPATLVLNQLKNPELYCRFDRWLVTNTLKLMSEQAEDATEHYHAFIRISKHSMLDRDFPGWVLKNLEVSGRPTSSIVLFVDEQDVSVSIKETKDFIAPLHQAGVAIGIGQFGTSANPEGILQQLDVEFACIDLSLIEGIDSNKEAMALFRQHLNSAHKNGLATVVPGIQDMSMYQELWDAGVHYTESCEGMGADEADVFDFSVIFGADPR
jgi:EAL domain-containing protein (putative c-di-GMP-specific phosphodiesterase class I)